MGGKPDQALSIYKAADRAVEAFAEAMRLPVDFKLDGARHYTTDQRKRPRSLIDAAMPQ